MPDAHHSTPFAAQQPLTIAVIGGGFSGTMVCVHLLSRCDHPVRVILIEPRQHPGRGLAYSTTDPCHLLNVPCARMGATPDDIEGFHRWANARLGETAPDAFLPRRDFGRYVEDQLGQVLHDLPSQSGFERLTTRAIAIEPGTASGARVICEDGTAIHADHVVLSLGSGPARVPEAVRVLADTPNRLITTPFASGALDAVRTTDRLLVLGTGLTMFDVVLSLEARGFKGTITAISRRGRSPRAHHPHTIPTWASDWASTLTGHRSARELVHAVRRAVRRAEQEGSDWRAIIDALRPHLTKVWQGLCETERRRFLRHAAPFWEVKRHRCAPQIASQIEACMQSGRLCVLAARIERCECDGSTINATLRRRGTSNGEHHSFDRVLVCAGPESDVTRWTSPLMQSLLAQGLVTPDALAMGLRTEDHAHPITAQGRAIDWLWIVGPLSKPRLWESTAVPELRVQARQVAGAILSLHAPASAH